LRRWPRVRRRPSPCWAASHVLNYLHDPKRRDRDLVAELEAAQQFEAELLAGSQLVTAAEVEELAGRYESGVRVFYQDGNLVVRTL